jgi:serine/threonine protein kinase
MTEAELPNNTKLGRYRITGRLGRGGMGVVYSGEDELLRRTVAIKVLSGSPSRSHESLERFLLEARAAARLNHPNVVAVHDIGQHDGRAYIVMELVPGGSLQARLELQGALPWREATRIVADVCRGLSAAHAARLIHRDIKPSNILLAAAGLAKLADFGLAKAPTLVSTRLTQAGDVLGTPQFMSPEHCSDQPLDERTDLYSLGVTYYTVLVGRPPFDSSDMVKVLYAHCSAPVPDPCKAVPGLPAGCTAIVSRAMAKSRTARFSTALEMIAAFESLLVDTIPIPPPLISVDRPSRAPIHEPGPVVASALPHNPVKSELTIRVNETTQPSSYPRPTTEQFPSPRTSFGRWRLALSGLGLVGILGVCYLVVAQFWPSSATPSPEHFSEVAPTPRPQDEVAFRPRANPLRGHKGAVNAVSVAGGLIVSAGDDATARVWPITGGNPIRILQHSVALHATALTPDGKNLATGGLANLVFFWNAKTGEKAGEFFTTSPVHALAFSPSGKQLAVGTGFELLLLDVFPVIRLRARLLPNHYRVSSVGFSADGKHLAACTYQKKVHRWEVATLAEMRVDDFPQELVTVTVSADGGRIAFASHEGNFYLWQPDQGRRPALLENTRTAITAMAFLPGRNAILFAGEWGGPLRLRDLETGTTRRFDSGGSKVIHALSVAPDGSLLAAGCSEGFVRLWDVAPAEGLRN